MAYTKASQKAVDRYVKNKYDSIMVRVAKGGKDELKQYAAKRGESLNGFIKRAIDETMAKEKSPPK